MSFVGLGNWWSGRFAAGAALAFLVASQSSCTLTFPEEWLEGDCGDGVLNAVSGEQCDDGDNNDGDGCSATCAEEPGWNCEGAPSVCDTTCGDGVVAGTEECDDGNTSSGDGCDDQCQAEGCGDEFVTADEECDDNNVTSGDGCSAACEIEEGWRCPDQVHCEEICGDGLVVGSEGCDDGGTTSGDGCSILCQEEYGWICAGTPSVCETDCGDGMPAGTEECDDGNNLNNDGCSAGCLEEAGWTCDGSPMVCNESCGDWQIVGGEGCDDGNTAAGDGCSAGCLEETGWTCDASPVGCSEVCGDGTRVGVELQATGCDDGNTADNDGCDSTCQLEHGYVCNGTSCGPVCGDGIVAGGSQAEPCDDGNIFNNDGCNSLCTSVEANYMCSGEPSVCEHTCTVPQALFEMSGCQAGQMCTNTGSYVAPTYGCVPAGATAYYQPCAVYTQCAAGSTCADIGAGPMCLPFCDINILLDCPLNGAEPAICAYYYPSNTVQTVSGICAPNDCDVVDQTGCSGGDWCEHQAEGVSFCNSSVPAGTVPLGGNCNTLECQPGLICLGGGANDECFAMCHLFGTDCGGLNCLAWNPADPVYGYCD
ncbi:MAG: DUF4215 domain-containing protein [bacterium]